MSMEYCCQVGMASNIDPGSKIQICKVDVSKRASCGDLLGNPVYCPITPGKGAELCLCNEIVLQTYHRKLDISGHDSNEESLRS